MQPELAQGASPSAKRAALGGLPAAWAASLGWLSAALIGPDRVTFVTACA